MKRERAALAKQSRELLALPTKKERSQARPPPGTPACHMPVTPFAGS